MAIQLVDVGDFLGQTGNDIALPDFPFLIRSGHKYKVANLQPAGEIRIDADYVGFKDKAVGTKQVETFLDEVIQNNVDLAIAPEYCVLLESVEERIKKGKVPAEGMLWVLGIEALTPLRLSKFKNEMKGCGCEVLHSLPNDIGKKKFFDVMFYIFVAKKKSGEKTLVILVQAKTEAMGVTDLEVDNLYVGSDVFVFNLKRDDEKIRLVSIICSDALSTNANSRAFWESILDRCLVVHLQLNPSPRSANFRTYRDLCFKLEGADTSEILCVNWSNKVKSMPKEKLNWSGLCGSAIYTKADSIQRAEDKIERNHHLGLYLTYRKDFKVFNYYFNYSPGIYIYNNHKVVSGGQKVQNLRTGPEMEKFLHWDTDKQDFELQHFVEDGFSRNCSEISENKLGFLITPYQPLAVERLLALCRWEVDKKTIGSWNEVTQLRSLGVDGEEIVIRPTVFQDPHANAENNRREMISALSTLFKQLVADPRNEWPICLSIFPKTSQVAYNKDRPLRNLHSNGYSATIVYLGNNPKKEHVGKAHRELIGALYINKEDIKLIGLWYTQDGQLICKDKGKLPTVNDDLLPHLDDILEVEND